MIGKWAFFVFVFTICIFASEVPIAVNDLTGNGLSETELSIISERLRSELAQTGSFAVMERGEMNAILQEMEFQMSGTCDDASCMVEVGQILGVQKIIAGSAGKLGDFYTISLRTIDVATGRIEASANYDYTGEISGFISSGLAMAAQKLATGDVDDTPVHIPNGAAETAELSQVIITTVPSGAELMINDSTVGFTPYNDKLLPGRYSLDFSLEGYNNLKKRMTLEEGLNFTKQFELDAETERKRGRVTRIISGSVSALALAGGIFMNSKVETYDSDAQKIYDEAVSNSTGAEQNELYLATQENGESALTTRNILYAVSGVSVTIFAVSFAF